MLEATRAGQDSAAAGRSATGEVRDLGAAVQPIQLQKTAGGFRLVGEGVSQSHVVVRVAYEVRRGNPFAQY